MNFFGYRIEKINEFEEMKLKEAIETLEKHGFRAVKTTKDKSKKVLSMQKANEKRISDTKNKIFSSIHKLKANNDKINLANIVFDCNVSRITAKKYLNIYLEDSNV